MFPPDFLQKRFSLNLSKFCQAPLNVWLFSFLPFRLSRWYLQKLGKLYFFLKGQEKALIQHTIRFILGNQLQEKSLRRLIRQTFRGIIDHYHEKLFVAYSNFPRLLRFLRERIEFQGEEKLREILSQGQGILLVTGHYGAVEFLPGALAVRGYPVSMICRFQTNRLRESLRERARSVGLELIDADSGNVLLSALQALRKGRILITECDEFDEWRPAPGKEIRFLNCPLTGDRTLDILRKRSGAPVVMGLVQRQGKKRYTLRITPIPSPEVEAESLSPACLRVLEANIQATPDHWYQWKKFGQHLKLSVEPRHDYQTSGTLAPEMQLPVPV